MNQTVPVTLPADVWWQLAVLAERTNGQVADELAAAVRDRIEAGRVPWRDHYLPTRERVAARVKAGWADRVIAAHLRVTVSTVQKHRKSLGLPGNGRAS